MRLIYLIVLLLLMQSCATHKNSCVDYRNVGGKAEQYKHKKKRKISETTNSYSFESVGKEVQESFEDYPLTASVSDDPVIFDNRGLWKNKTRIIPNPSLTLNDSAAVQVGHKLIIPADTVITRFDQNFKKAKSLGIISLFSGIASVLALAAPVLIIPLALLSFITGVVSLKKFRKSLRKKYRALPIIGIILSGVMIAIIILAVILLILFWTQFE